MTDFNAAGFNGNPAPATPERSHAVFAPSAAHRWFNCPGSIALTENVLSVSSVYAKEGTSVHTVIAECLTTGEDSKVHTGRLVPVEGEEFLFDEAAVEHAQVFLDYVRNKARDGYQFAIEVKLDLSHLAEGQYGHGDAVLYHPETHDLIVADYKHGRGVVVHVEDNPQLLSYGSGAYHLHSDARSLTLTVVQPRAGGEPVREWHTSIERLVAFENEFRAAVARAQMPEAPLIPGDWCQFCPGLGICPAVRVRSLELARAEFAMVEPPPVDRLNSDELGAILSQAVLVEHWIEAVREEALRRALGTGRQIPAGWKLVRRRTLRRWKDEANTEVALVNILELGPDAIWEHRLLSPAKIEKLLGKRDADAIAPLVEKPVGELTLAPIDDKREAIVVDPRAEGFEVVGQQLRDSVKLLETGE